MARRHRDPRSEAARACTSWDLADVAAAIPTTQGSMETLAHESLATGRSGFSSMARIPIVHWHFLGEGATSSGCAVRLSAARRLEGDRPHTLARDGSIDAMLTTQKQVTAIFEVAATTSYRCAADGSHANADRRHGSRGRCRSPRKGPAPDAVPALLFHASSSSRWCSLGGQKPSVSVVSLTLLW